MGEIAIGVATAILEKLATQAYQEVALVWGLKDEVDRLQNSMLLINAFLVDAENKKAGNGTITESLRQLRAAILDAEDVLDEIECEALRNKVVKMHGSATRKVRRFFSSSNPLAFRCKMAQKIKHVKERIDEIGSNWKTFGLTKQHPNNFPLITQKIPLRETHSHLNGSLVIGRDGEKEKIVSFLMSPQTHDDKIPVLPIVGIGGLGKTTLAKLVYNDARIIEHFESRMWVCVSDEFDVKRLIFEILKAMGRQSIGDLSFDQLQSLLRKEFPKKKSLLVLDDVWNEDRKKWVELSLVLLGDEFSQHDSKILVTTRSEEVALIMGTVPQHKLKELPEGESWKLFVKWAFREREEGQHPKLEEIGKQIVKKCKGVPLAVVSLASMLYSKLDESEWKNVRDSEIWKMDEQKVDILPALRLSYYHLPSHLKQCFSYCSIFPKDFLFREVNLIYFWMAHGLLQSTNENEDLEEVGKLYMKELISRCFLQIDEKLYGNFLLRMHDLVHDLAMSTMQSEVAVMSVSSLATNVNKNIRHISIQNSGDQQVSAFNHTSNNIRSIGFWHSTVGALAVTKPFVKWISNKFKYLRVLDLGFSSLESLPDCFSKMKQLRYLDLSGEALKKLPDSIFNLQNLQFLDIGKCPLEDLPKDMRNLISLRFLDLTTKASSLSHCGLGCLKSLRFLGIAWCDNLVNLPCDLMQLTALRTLEISSCKKIVSLEIQELEEEEKENEGVQDLNLERFVVVFCPRLVALPHWLQRSSKTLRYMYLGYCRSLRELPEWLPNLTSLEELVIVDCPQLSERCKQDSGLDWPKIAHVSKHARVIIRPS